MADSFCTDCNEHTEVVFDHVSGDTLCSQCGLILDSHPPMKDTDRDPNRVGSATNPIVTNATTTTMVSNSCPFDKKSRHLVMAFGTISQMADRLSLVSTIKDRANQIYKKLIDKHHYCRGKNLDTILAACLFVACQEENLPRTLKEICSVTNNSSTSKKDIGRAKSFILQHLKDIDVNDVNNNNNNNDNINGSNSRVVRSSDFVKRFCSNAGITDNHVTKAAFETAVKAEEDIDVRRSPLSLAAAVVYIVSKLGVETSKRVGYKEIAVATGVAEGTIKSSCKDLKPYLERIIPKWFASENDHKGLSIDL